MGRTEMRGRLRAEGDIIRPGQKTKPSCFRIMSAAFSASSLCKLALGLAAALMLSACAKDVDARGNLPTPDSLTQLAPGEQTRQDVQALLGTPATTAVFDNETWY